MADEEKSQPPDKTRRAVVIATLGIVALLALALFVAFWLVPFLQTRAVVRGPYPVAFPPGDAIERLGGEREALRRLSAYLRLPDWMADVKPKAAWLVACCGRRGAYTEPFGGPFTHVPEESVWAPRATTPLAPKAASVLARALGNPDPAVRFAAAKGLAWIGPEAREAVPALVRALGDGSEHVRKAARDALKKIRPPEGPRE